MTFDEENVDQGTLDQGIALESIIDLNLDTESDCFKLDP